MTGVPTVTVFKQLRPQENFQMIKKLFLISLLLTSTYCYSAGVPSGTQYNGVFTVISLLADGNGSLRYFNVSETIPNCSVSTSQFWLDNGYVSEEGKKTLLSVVLVARTSGLKARVYYTVADGYCRATMVGLE